MVTPVRRRTALSDFVTGTGLLFRGIGLVLRDPRLLWLGLVPGAISFLVVVSVGGAGSILGALSASLLLGLADTTGKYLAPEFGDFFFYLSVIFIVFLFPHGLFGKAHA